MGLKEVERKGGRSERKMGIEEGEKNLIRAIFSRLE